jgi:hypothetical protein
MIVNFILERQCEGIKRLLSAGVYTAAYPLHDVSFKIFIYTFEINIILKSITQ